MQLLDFPLHIAKWLFRNGVLEEQQTSPHASKGGDRVQLNGAATASLRNGKGMHALLVNVYKEAGLPFPVQASSLNSGEDAAGRLANWNALLPQMQKTFAVSLTADEKALLIAGHPEVLEHVVELIYTRGSANHHDTVRQLANAGKKKKWQQAVNNDNISHAIVMTTQAAGVYACVMASLLSVFVPQWCPANDREPEPHVCTTYDNFNELTYYNKGVLGVNFITLFIFVATQTFFGYREYFVIEAFDLDPSLPSDNLTEELELYPSFKAKLNKLNLASYVLSIFLVIIVSSNFILSCILILGNYSAGKTSITGLISSALLVAPRCLAWYLSAQQSYQRGLPISQFSKLPALANTIDADWRFKDEVYRPGGGGEAPDGATENELYSA